MFRWKSSDITAVYTKYLYTMYMNQLYSDAPIINATMKIGTATDSRQ